MDTEILANVTPQETRVAILEGGLLQEVMVERTRRRGIVGNLYRGRVNRLLPGMQAAFVDAGLERTAFLHASDVAVPLEPATEEHDGRPRPITQLLREGQDILVQVIKDPLGGKGARLTTHITVPSRYLVFVPYAPHNTGISTRIEDEAERARLKAIIDEFAAADGGGYIVRTAAEYVSREDLERDRGFLRRLWASIHDRINQTATAGGLVHEDLPLTLRILRDLADGDVRRVRIDDPVVAQKASEFADRFIPEIAGRVEYYADDRPIFDLYGVDDEILRALDRKVALKSGGYLIIDQTEAMTTIDVNTGAFVGHRSVDDTIVKTNLEAAQSIARQLRLRNLGGIIIIDFIDMQRDEDRRQVVRTLQKHLENDRARSQVCEISSLGLVEMTRRRTRESLGHVLCEPCPSCGGRGVLRTPETVSYEILREIRRQAVDGRADEVLVLASQDVVDQFLDEQAAALAALEGELGIRARFQVEALYSQEQFDVVLVSEPGRPAETASADVAGPASQGET